MPRPTPMPMPGADPLEEIRARLEALERAVAREPEGFVSARRLARALDVTTGALDYWIEDGTLPSPALRVKMTRLWRRAHYDTFTRTGRWPDEAFRSGVAPRGG